ncbi:MAG: asparagine synthase (glutamine-hydrolyzing) [Gaiellaceae bacterium]
MCGIAGIASLNGRPVEPEELERMRRSLRHRGPDDEGSWVGPGIGLVNLRLAILDLSPAGHQPMANDDESVVLAYNGELYNFLELMPELEARGHRFRSRSDTEVVLRAYEEWGRECVHRFNGMFAFAVWDARRRQLFLARDRFGIKPLYYAVHDDRLLFGSEVKALLEAGLPVGVSPEALVEYFTFQNVLSDRTLFRGVRLLPAGHTLTLEDGRLAAERYWDLELDPDESVTEADWTERTRAVFEEAVTRQLVSDVPVGSFLSGGMDSASIAAVASRSIPRLMTFTGGFDLSSVTGMELVFDERADAEHIASTFRTEHYEMVMHAGDMAWVLPELIWHLEDLRVGMCYQNHYIARLASKFVKVALAGTGGDELFAGYPWRYDLVADAASDGDFDRRYYEYWMRLVPDAEKADFFAPEISGAVSADLPFEVYRSVLEPVAGLDPVAKALYFEAKTFLHGLLLVEDRVSMAHGLEVRVPFLDNELVELARRMPSRLKHADAGGKRILRRAMEGLLPAEILEKPKQGFSPPDESWYRGHSMELIRETLLDRRSLERGYFQPAFIRRVLDEHLHGRTNHRLLIWSLLCFEWWNRLFLDGESTARHQVWHSAIAAERGVPSG